jgi:hypothetical protein
VADESSDGFRQDPAFYYFTGLENTVGAILAIDGRSHESWLFLRSPTPPELSVAGPAGFEGSPGSDAVKRAGIEHVVDWSELANFLEKNGMRRQRFTTRQLTIRAPNCRRTSALVCRTDRYGCSPSPIDGRRFTLKKSGHELLPSWMCKAHPSWSTCVLPPKPASRP